MRNHIMEYRIGPVIGTGTYGEVRCAVHVGTGSRVALKIVELSRFSEESVRMIRREVKILKLLDHEHCARLIDVQENVPFRGEWCDNCACTEFCAASKSDVCVSCSHQALDHSPLQERRVLLIAQELAAGGELFNIIASTGPLEEPLARYYFKQLISALEYCHNKGICHRDLKPENLAVSGSFDLKLVDFGLASLHHECNAEQQPLLHSGVGSIPYSAPECYYIRELYEGRGYCGTAADLWSAAVILWIMLLARPPFLRPLMQTFGINMQKCRHFTALIRGDNSAFVGISPSARQLLQAMFQVDPRARLTIDAIKRSVWYNGTVPSWSDVRKTMWNRTAKAWASIDRHELVSILSEELELGRTHDHSLTIASSTRCDISPGDNPLSPAASPFFAAAFSDSPEVMSSNLKPLSKSTPSSSPYVGPAIAVSLLDLSDSVFELPKRCFAVERNHFDLSHAQQCQSSITDWSSVVAMEQHRRQTVCSLSLDRQNQRDCLRMIRTPYEPVVFVRTNAVEL